MVVGQVPGDGLRAGVQALVGQLLAEPHDQVHDLRWGRVRVRGGPSRAGLEDGIALAAVAGQQSLSSFLCKGRSLEVGVDAVGVDEGELFEGLFPVGHDLALDEASGGFAFVGWSAAFLLALAGSFVLDVADREP